MLNIEHLTVTYSGNVKALRTVDLSLEEGKIYGILGPSGAGKSSFLKGILDLVPRTGTVRFRGKPIKEFAKKIAYIEQKEDIDRTFPITVFQCVLMGCYPRLGFFKKPGKEEKRLVFHYLEKVGLLAFKDRQIGELSGGQFQRVLIARAFMQNATLLFLDEPFVGIDVGNEEIVINLLKEMTEEGRTVFVVHHNLRSVPEFFDEIILINEEVIASGPTSTVFTPENLAKTFKHIIQPAFIPEKMEKES